MRSFYRILRFVEIDLNFFIAPLAAWKKLQIIVKTDVVVFTNVIFRRKKYESINLNNGEFYYDTPFATKTFLSAVYDLYLVTLKGTIFMDKNPTIVDVGANIGQFMFACKNVFPDAKVYSIEPDPNIFKILKKNTKNYKNVTVYNLALNNIKRKIKFYVSSEFSEWSSLKIINDKKYTVSVVNAEKGDVLLRSIKQIDLLKIDVEGAEYDVVLGLLDTLKRTKYLLIEVSLERNDEDKGSSKLMSLLLKSDFRIRNIGRIFSEGRGGNQGAVDMLFQNKSI
jgi:FkbM family methyltransferase